MSEAFSAEEIRVNQAYRDWLNSHGGYGALSRRGVLEGRFDEVITESGPEYFSDPFAQGDYEGTGIYDDNTDYLKYKFGYPELGQEFVRAHTSTLPSLATTTPEPTTAPTPEPEPEPEPEPVVSPALQNLSQSANTALSQVQADPSIPFVQAQRQALFNPVTSSPATPTTGFSAGSPTTASQPFVSFVNRIRSEPESLTPFIKAVQDEEFKFPSLSNIASQTPSATVPVRQPSAEKFRNIIENILQNKEVDEDDFVEVVSNLSDNPVIRQLQEDVQGFVNVSDPVLSDPFLLDEFSGEEDSGPSFSFGGRSPEEVTQGKEFESGLTESLFGGTPFSSSANPEVGPPTAPINAMITPSDIARAEAEGRPTLGMQFSRFVDEYGTKAALAFDKTEGKKDIGQRIIEGIPSQFAGEFISSTGIGAGIPFGGALIGSGVMAVGKTAFDMAQSEYSGFGVGDFFSASINNLFVGLIGDSVEDMEDKQDEDEAMMEGIFSMPGTSTELEGQLAQLTGRNLTSPTKTDKQIADAISGARSDPSSIAKATHSVGDPKNTGYDDTADKGPEPSMPGFNDPTEFSEFARGLGFDPFATGGDDDGFSDIDFSGINFDSINDEGEW